MNTPTLQEYYEKIQAAARKQAVSVDASMKKFSLSFAELREKGISMYAAYTKDFEDMENAVLAISNERNYSEVYKQEQIAKVQAVYNESIRKLKEEFSSLAKATLETTEAALNKMLAAAPTQEQLNLLQTLQLRGEDLTEDEVMRIACELASNYNAIKALQQIASKVHIKLNLPEQYDSESLMRNLSWVTNYLNERVQDFGNPWRQMRPNGRAFFGSEWEDLNYNTYAVEVFDNHNPIQMQETSVKNNAVALTDDERSVLSGLFGGLKTSKEIEKAVLQATLENDSIAKLIAKHEVYKNFLPGKDK